VLPQSVHNIATQVVIASSDPVLIGAQRTLGSGGPPQTLRDAIKVKNVTSDIISISAQGKTAAQAERTADAVANSYVAYVNSPSRPGSPVQARILQPAPNATATPLSIRLLVGGGFGLLLGLLIGAIVALATGRKDRRLTERDEIADSIGIPVLTSISVGHPSDAAGWVRLLEDYQPGDVDAWRLRKTLRYLGLTDADHTDLSAGRGFPLAVFSLSSDAKALALGPQLAVFAASLGIPTALVIGPQQDVNATAMLRAACTTPLRPSGRAGNLRVAVSDHRNADQLPSSWLAIVVGVVDGQTPQVAERARHGDDAASVGCGDGGATGPRHRQRRRRRP
jgi:capsular polysaccharide biosynthesis protein